MTPQPLKSPSLKSTAPANTPKLVNRIVAWTLPIVGVVVVTVISLGGWLFIWPKVQEIKALQVAIEAQNSYNEKLVAANEKLVSFQAAVKKFASANATAVEKLDRILPTTEEVPALMTGSEQLAQELALVLLSVDTGGNKPGSATAAGSSVEIPGISKVPLSISFTGNIDYPTYRKILTMVASNIRLMDLRKASFGDVKNGRDGVNFDLDAYYAPLPKR